MEIYSPNSKQVQLFKKNQFKTKEIEGKKPEIETINIMNFQPVTDEYKPSAVEKLKNKIADRLRAFFQVDEVVR